MQKAGRMSQLVMVIDDSPVIRTILEVCLRRVGYRIVSCEHGVAALDWLATPDATMPTLVLVDLGLPKLDGYAVIQSLKARPGVERSVFVILSRRDSLLDRIKGRLVGAQGYVTKPFRAQTILALVEAHLGAGEVIREPTAPQPQASQPCSRLEQRRAVNQHREVHAADRATRVRAGSDGIAAGP